MRPGDLNVQMAQCPQHGHGSGSNDSDNNDHGTGATLPIWNGQTCWRSKWHRGITQVFLFGKHGSISLAYGQVFAGE
jgi:hypothetical protein